jgi:hypothetical protein
MNGRNSFLDIIFIELTVATLDTEGLYLHKIMDRFQARRLRPRLLPTFLKMAVSKHPKLELCA